MSGPPEGTGPEPAKRIRFGSAPGNEIPADWAPELLTRLHSRDEDGFGIELLEMTQERILGRTSLRIVRPRKSKGEQP